MHVKSRLAHRGQSTSVSHRRSRSVTTLDHTIQETNVWLKAVEEDLQLDNRQQAYNALRAALHGLRDRVQPKFAIKLGAQLPIPMRGV